MTRRRKEEDAGGGRRTAAREDEGVRRRKEADAGGGRTENGGRERMEYDEEDGEGEGTSLLTACLSVSCCGRGRRCPSS